MSKRPYTEIEEQEQGAGKAAKKSKTVDAVEHLTDRADDLIECLLALKKQGKSADSALTQRLASLSRELLPSFQSIAHADDAAEEPTTTQTPVLPLLTPWSPAEVADKLPPVPPILDQALERASFTHAGAVKGTGQRSYEKLEWLGDAYLYLMSTAYIYLTFPHMRHGDMCQMRQVLVQNATLKDYSVQYGFDKRVNLPEEYSLNGRVGGSKASAKDRGKVLGDVFEAHVAAVILSDPINGTANAASWLKSLWSTTIAKQIKTRILEVEQAPLLVPTMSSMPDGQQQAQTPLGQPQQRQANAKEKLAAEVSLHTPKVFVEYRSLDADGQPHKTDQLTGLKLFTQGAFLVGYGETVLLGSGKAKGKKEANEKAAQHALGNKKLLNVYRDKKQAIQENKRQAQEEASKGLDF